jgi:hypothetical protein
MIEKLLTDNLTLQPTIACIKNISDTNSHFIKINKQKIVIDSSDPIKKRLSSSDSVKNSTKGFLYEQW